MDPLLAMLAAPVPVADPAAPQIPVHAAPQHGDPAQGDPVNAAPDPVQGDPDAPQIPVYANPDPVYAAQAKAKAAQPQVPNPDPVHVAQAKANPAPPQVPIAPQVGPPQVPIAPQVADPPAPPQVPIGPPPAPAPIGPMPQVPNGPPPKAKAKAKAKGKAKAKAKAKAPPLVPAVAPPIVPAANPPNPPANPIVPAANPIVPAANPIVPAANPIVPAANPIVPAANPPNPNPPGHDPVDPDASDDNDSDFPLLSPPRSRARSRSLRMDSRERGRNRPNNWNNWNNRSNNWNDWSNNWNEPDEWGAASTFDIRKSSIQFVGNEEWLCPRNEVYRREVNPQFFKLVTILVDKNKTQQDREAVPRPNNRHGFIQLPAWFRRAVGESFDSVPADVVAFLCTVFQESLCSWPSAMEFINGLKAQVAAKTHGVSWEDNQDVILAALGDGYMVARIENSSEREHANRILGLFNIVQLITRRFGSVCKVPQAHLQTIQVSQISKMIMAINTGLITSEQQAAGYKLVDSRLYLISFCIVLLSLTNNCSVPLRLDDLEDSSAWVKRKCVNVDWQAPANHMMISRFTYQYVLEVRRGHRADLATADSVAGEIKRMLSKHLFATETLIDMPKKDGKTKVEWKDAKTSDWGKTSDWKPKWKGGKTSDEGDWQKGAWKWSDIAQTWIEKSSGKQWSKTKRPREGDGDGEGDGPKDKKVAKVKCRDHIRGNCRRGADCKFIH